MQESELLLNGGPVVQETQMKEQPRILISNMPSSTSLYSKSKIKAAVVPRPYVGMASLAACCLERGIDAKIIDLGLSDNPGRDLEQMLATFKPHYVAFSFSTPLFKECCEYAEFVKQKHPDVFLIAGGVHPSIFPEEVLEKSVVDVAVTGEGDFVLPEIILTEDLHTVKGIAFRDTDGKIVRTPRPKEIENLDVLPFPAWHLFDVKKYKNPRIMARRNPVGTIETSRGCLAGCTYCNKTIFGRTWRFKTPERVVDEMAYMLEAGFKEIHVYDDMFTTDLERAKRICDLIVERGLDISWRLDCGIRVDSVDQEFFQKLKKSGCYCVGFGIESGSQEILDHIDKGLKVDCVQNAVKWAREAGLETVGFFMFGLPGETEETMEKTIALATSVGLDYAKVTLATPYPGTGFYGEMLAQKRILTKEWSAYNFHTPSRVYNHPNLSWETMEEYYHKFYRRFYFRPGYIMRRVAKGITRGTLAHDVYYFVKTFT